MSRGNEMLHLDYYLPLVFNLARILLILVFAFICTHAMGRIFRGLRNYIVKMMLKAGGGSEYESKSASRRSPASRGGPCSFCCGQLH